MCRRCTGSTNTFVCIINQAALTLSRIGKELYVFVVFFLLAPFANIVAHSAVEFHRKERKEYA
jgi:hypothetical protein